MNYLKGSGREGELASVGLFPPTSTQTSSQVLFLLWESQLLVDDGDMEGWKSLPNGTVGQEE